MDGFLHPGARAWPMGLNRTMRVKIIAQAMIKDAKQDLRDPSIVDVSISSESYGVEATSELSREISRRAHRQGLVVYRELKYSYFTFRRNRKDGSNS
jgi:hypothetical protein